jgi:hypothetical protein
MCKKKLKLVYASPEVIELERKIKMLDEQIVQASLDGDYEKEAKLKIEKANLEKQLKDLKAKSSNERTKLEELQRQLEEIEKQIEFYSQKGDYEKKLNTRLKSSDRKRDKSFTTKTC